MFSAAGVDEEKLALVLANVRGPVEREGDLMAQMAATLAAERRVHELCDTHGTATVRRTNGPSQPRPSRVGWALRFWRF